MTPDFLWWLTAAFFLAAVAGWYWPGMRILQAGRSLLKPSSDPVSVVVACGKTEDNIRAFLDHLFSQQYPLFEVVVVLNGEGLIHEATLADFAAGEPRLRYSLQPHPGKKEALTKGIQAASYDILLFTDADCYPSTPYWIREMASALVPPYEGVLGYGPVERSAGWFNVLARFDHFLVGVHYLGAAAWGRPYMGVGRNLAYRRQVFEAAGGHSRHMHLASGDDDLFVQAAARHHKFQVQWHPESFVYTRAPSGFREFIVRKARHFTTAYAYHPMPLFLLQAHFWGRFMVWMSPLLLHLAGVAMPQSLFFVIFYLITSIWMWKSLSTKLCEKSLWMHAPWCDLLLTFVWLGAGVSSIFRNKQRWT